MSEIKPRLVMHHNDAEETEYELTLATVIIGREPINDIMFANPEVSRRHARLTKRNQEQTYALEDLGSTNGTYVNGRRLDTAVLLKDGDIIDLGETIRLTYTSLHDRTEPAVNPPAILPKASSTLLAAEQATPKDPFPALSALSSISASPVPKSASSSKTIDEALRIPLPDPTPSVVDAEANPSQSQAPRPWWQIALPALIGLLILLFLILLLASYF